MELQDYIDLYNKKNPLDPFVRAKDYDLLFEADKGFCEIKTVKDAIYIGQMCSNARYWVEKRQILRKSVESI